MKKVIVTYEAIVPDEDLKDEADMLDCYDCLNDAVDCEGLDALIDASYEYTVHFEILDV